MKDHGFLEGREAARKLFICFRELSGFLHPGLLETEVEGYIENLLNKHNLNSGLKGFKGYPSVCSISRNTTAVHGVPAPTILNELDICTIDIVAEYQGWFADGAWTYLIRSQPDLLRFNLQEKEIASKIRLLVAAWRTSLIAARTAITGRTISDISLAAVDTATQLGVAILPGCYGHGIGREIHQPPHVPFSSSDPLFQDAQSHQIPKNTLINVEPVVLNHNPIKAKPKLVVASDGWGIRTEPTMLSAQFEFTVWTGTKRTINGEVISLPEISVFSDRILKRPIFF